MNRRTFFFAAGSAAILLLQQRAFAAAHESFPTGWLRLIALHDERPWTRTNDCIRLYLPPGNKPVRGIFVCFVFHSGDRGQNPHR